MANMPSLPTWTKWKSRVLRESRRDSKEQPGWHPPALRTRNLVFATILCWVLIATLQSLLIKSEKDDGIIFAADINGLPLRRSFWYLYFPTLLAVMFSIYWTWIDLDAKRYEPYHQLSTKHGSLGKDSLFLEYPFDFMPLVPFHALKSRHWLVFWASFATVLTMFGVVPAQAGIFSTRKVTRTLPTQFSLYEHLPDAAVSFSKLTGPYSLSTYSIIVFNETLPSWMTHNYTLRPFIQPADSQTVPSSLWTAQTTLYGVDLQCEVAKGPEIYNELEEERSNYTAGLCTFSGDPGLVGNFSAVFSAQTGTTKTEQGLQCDTYNHTFFAAFGQRVANRTHKATAMFCNVGYFQQSVRATVDGVLGMPLDYEVLSPKESVSVNPFNFTTFEEALDLYYRPPLAGPGSLPYTTTPSYTYQEDKPEYAGLVDMIPYMVSMAIAMGKRPLKDYSDPDVLKASFSQPFELLFARAMNEVLKTNSSLSAPILGESTQELEAVVLEPIFTITVEIILFIVSLCGIALIYLRIREKKHTLPGRLHSDPGTVAAVMSLISDDDNLLSRFESLGSYTIADMKNALRDESFRLTNAGTVISEESQRKGGTQKGDASRKAELKTASPVQPAEFHLGVALPFIGLFAALIITLATLFSKSKPNGLPLPSRYKLVQNLLRSYVPTAIATSIEPMWILINRLLCMMQPMQELLSTKANPSQSIDRNYSSLPPQLTMFRALRSKHYMLALVCAMALLANILATAFAGLLFQESRSLAHPTRFRSLQDTKLFRPGEWYPGQDSPAHIIVADSNSTHGTRLPPWTDKHRTYVPFYADPPVQNLAAEGMQVHTTAVGAEVDCEDIDFGSGNTLGLGYYKTDNTSAALSLWLSMSLPDEKGRLVKCGIQNDINSTRQVTWSVESDQSNRTTCTTKPAGTEFTVTYQETGDEPATNYTGFNPCASSIILGWVRLPSDAPNVCGARSVFEYLAGPAPRKYSDDGPEGSETQAYANITAYAARSTSIKFVRCLPRLTLGKATISVDVDGYITEPVRDYQHEEGDGREIASRLLTNRTMDILEGWWKYTGNEDTRQWHKNPYTTSQFHYFLNQTANSSGLLDPSQPLPQLEDITSAANSAYAKLFAIWIGLNTRDILQSATNTTILIDGHTLHTEERFFFNTPLFIISEVILSIYIIVAILVYANRPAKFLPRLPKSIGAIISLVATSTAVRDFKDTAKFSTEERTQFLKKSGFVFGYGSYVGVDGAVHVGIERAPFVRQTRKVRPQRSGSFTWLQRLFGTYRGRYDAVCPDGEDVEVPLKPLSRCTSQRTD